MEGTDFRPDQSLEKIAEQTEGEMPTGSEQIIKMIELLDSGEHKDRPEGGIAYGAIGVWELIRQIKDTEELFDIIDALEETSGDMASVKEIGMSVAASKIAISSRISGDLEPLHRLLDTSYFGSLSEMSRLYVFQAMFEKGGPEDVTVLSSYADSLPMNRIKGYYSESFGLRYVGKGLLSKMDLSSAVETITKVANEDTELQDSWIGELLNTAFEQEIPVSDMLTVLEGHQDAVSSVTGTYLEYMAQEMDKTELIRFIAIAGAMSDTQRIQLADACSARLDSDEIVDFFLAHSSERDTPTQHYSTVERLREQAREMSGMDAE
jgi:hypothetical protein